MRFSEVKDVAEFVLIMANEGARDIPRITAKLVLIAEALHRMYLIDCNWGLDDERERERLEKEAEHKVKMFGPGFGVVFNADPRGAPLFVTLPSGKTYDWGQRGVVVPYIPA